ncbi:MAG: sulfatase-like hydrolase/transferase [Desulfofustis sp.]|nr:sulfatase-like hydrolase/transferase [Desulfofustis sp.]
MSFPSLSSVRALLGWVGLPVLHCAGFLLLLISATEFLESFGGLPSLLPAWRVEIPLLAYLYLYFRAIIRPSRWQPVIAALPIILVYAIFDIYHVLFGRQLRIIEVTELPEMFLVLPFLNMILLVSAVVLPLAIFLRAVQWRWRLRPLVFGGLPLLALVVAVEGFPAPFMAGFEWIQKPVHWMSDTKQARLNGRIGMALYNEARRINSLEKTMAYRDNSRYLNAFDNMVETVEDVRRKSNVHLIVLESFLDPKLLRNARFSRNPEHPSFTALFKDQAGLSISPVFGGSTAQAEFEVLCGVPALRELSGIEFDVFTGARTLCLPNILGQAGYHTMATNAFYPDFFNATKAYEGTGFQSIYFPREHAPVGGSYFQAGDVTGEFFMYDGTLFSQNLAFVSDWMRQHPGKPLLNYVMTIYGHTPHLINLDKRPRLVKVSGTAAILDDQLERAVNQYYYRTEAIAAYVRELMRIDPQSIIILVSDHLPSLTYGPNTYEDLHYIDNIEGAIHANRIYIVENGRPVRYDTMHHYEIPGIILSYLTRDNILNLLGLYGSQPGPQSRSNLREQYLAVMAQAMDGSPIFFRFGNRKAYAK